MASVQIPGWESLDRAEQAGFCGQGLELPGWEKLGRCSCSEQKSRKDGRRRGVRRESSQKSCGERQALPGWDKLVRFSFEQDEPKTDGGRGFGRMPPPPGGSGGPREHFTPTSFIFTPPRMEIGGDAWYCCMSLNPKYENSWDGGEGDLPGDFLEIPCPINPDKCRPPLIGRFRLPSSAEVDVAMEAVQFEEGGGSEDEIELMKYGWTMLYQNTDLVDWLMCELTRKESKGDCTVNKILHVNGRERARLVLDEASSKCNNSDDCRQWWTCYSYRIAMPGVGGGEIYFCRTNGKWETMVRKWANGGEGLRTYAAAHVASDILHEVLHTCGRAAGDKQNSCDITYIIQNNMLWALLQRYPIARLTEYAARLVADLDALWYHDASVGFDQR